jgi:hypothetical protein
MMVFLFGAGASFGSDSRNTPPLGANLFGELQDDATVVVVDVPA